MARTIESVHLFTELLEIDNSTVAIRRGPGVKHENTCPSVPTESETGWVVRLNRLFSNLESVMLQT